MVTQKSSWSADSPQYLQCEYLRRKLDKHIVELVVKQQQREECERLYSRLPVFLATLVTGAAPPEVDEEKAETKQKV